MNTSNNHSHSAEDEQQVDHILQLALADESPPELNARLDAHFDALRDRIAHMSSGATRIRSAWASLPRLAWATTGIGATVAAVLVISALLSSSNPTWADVVDRLQKVAHFSATVFLTKDPLADPQKLEIWRSSDGRSRVHYRKQVYFGSGEKVVKVYDVATGRPVEFEKLSRREFAKKGMAMPAAMIRKMGSMQGLELNRLMKMFSPGATLSEPLPNAEASIEKDMSVFDVQCGRTPEWFRIWVLKSSRLPVRIRYMDPRRGDSMECLLDYGQEQPSEAFDPDAFATSLGKQESAAKRLYNLLRDPGSKPASPEQLHEKVGYHMPKIEEVGRTKDGIVWVLSSNASNRLPNRRVIHGFGLLTDNLGQEYLHVSSGRNGPKDSALEYFVPFMYRTDFRMPSSYTLNCWTQPDHWSQPADVIGTVRLTNWTEDAPISNRLGPVPGADEHLKKVMEQVCGDEDWDRFDRLVALIPGEPEDDPLAYFRETQRLRKMRLMRNDDGVWAITSRLYPLLKRRYKGYDRWNDLIVRNHVRQLVKRDRRTEAAEVLRWYLPKTRTTYSRHKATFAGFLAKRLYDDGSTLADVNKLFGFDLTKDEPIAKEIRSFGGFPCSVSDAEMAPWRAYVRNIAKRYATRPLPDEFAFLYDVEPFDFKRRHDVTPLPGHEGYLVMPLFHEWDTWLQVLAHHKGWHRQLLHVADSLKNKTSNTICVCKRPEPYEAIIERLIRDKNLEVVEKTVSREVWVARYDGRRLPAWRFVRPLDASHLGTKRIGYGGGRTVTTPRGLFDRFQGAVNHEVRQPGEWILIIDETGLPSKPDKNQTYGTICLADAYAFWEGDEAIELARKWFEENFGITFHEEQRELVVHELRPAE